MSINKVEHRAARVSLVTGLSTFLSIAFQIISVPICLKYWGKDAYGSWLALYAAFMLVRSLDGGFVSYVGNKLNYLYHQDEKTLQKHLASSISGIVIISALQVLIAVAAITYDDVSKMLGLTSDNAIHLQSGWALMVLIVTWALSGSYLGIVHRLLIPAGMMYQAAWWSMGFQVSQFAGIILAAMLHSNMLQASLIFALIQLLIYFGSAIYIRKKLPAYYPWWQGGTARTGIKDLGRSIWLTVSNLVQQLSTNGIVILISVFSGPMSVPVYTTVRTLANLWTNVTSVLTAPLLPEVVRYHAKGEGQRIVTIAEVYWVVVGTLVNLGVLIGYPLIKPLYSYWTSNEVVLDKPLLCMLLASVVVANVGGLITLYLNGINSLRIVLITSLIRAVTSLSVGGYLFYFLGIAGFGIGILLGEVLVLFVTGLYFVKKELPRQSVKLPFKSFAPITVSTVFVLLFLTFEGFGFSFEKTLYPVALLIVVSTTIWGWRGLELEVRLRLKAMIGTILTGKK